MASANGVLPRIQQNVQVAIISPVGIAVNNLGTSSLSVIGANANRRAITFSNPGGVNVYICPDNLVANNATLGGMFVLFPGGEKTIIAEGNINVNCGWNAIAASGSNNPLTILEYV